MEDTDNMSSIETKELRGFTIKVMISIISSVILSTVWIVSVIKDYQTEQKLLNQRVEFQDAKYHTLDIRVTQLELEMKEANKKRSEKDD